MLPTQSGFVIWISVGRIARVCTRGSIESGACTTSNPSRGTDRVTLERPRGVDRLAIMILTLLAAALALGDTTVLRHRPPSQVGMDTARLALIDRAVKQGLMAGGFPGAAVVVGRRGAIVWEKGYGSADWGWGLPAVQVQSTLYDLASLTKVVATSAAAMVLYDRGKLKLDVPVSHYLPQFRGGDKGRVTVRDLLMHRSGLPAGRSLASARNARQARRLIIETPLEVPPGTRTEYSDVGADVLGFVSRRSPASGSTGSSSRTIYRRLGLRNTLFLPGRDRRARVAPTENYPPRGYPIRGEVHDDAAFALGGVAGHAGLFATASDLAVFAQMMLNGGKYNGVRIVSDTTVARFTERWAGARALGWDMCVGGGELRLLPRPTVIRPHGLYRDVAVDRSRPARCS